MHKWCSSSRYTQKEKCTIIRGLCDTGRKRAAAKPKKRVMILMSDTGGGHRASAEALQAGFQQLYGDEYQV